MGNYLGAVCDEFYVSSRLFLKLDLPLQRETVLHFFDRIRKDYPSLAKMHRREDGTLILEDEGADDRPRRWLRLDRNSLRIGQFAPTNLDEVQQYGQLVYTQAPYHLTFSELDYDHLEVVFGFELNYRGNHDQLVVEALQLDQTALGSLLADEDAKIIDAQPFFGVALNAGCDLQAYVEIKSRTTTFEVRQDSYEDQPITVMLTLRKYWGVEPPKSLAEAYNSLFQTAHEIASDKIVPHFVNPLAMAIATRP